MRVEIGRRAVCVAVLELYFWLSMNEINARFIWVRGGALDGGLGRKSAWP